MELVGNVLDSKNAKQHSCALFLDLSKAFDTLNHDILLNKLDKYGIHGVCNDWFRSYLNNRKLLCKINTAENTTIKSDYFNITYGTAQGSCLGPLLFILFTNDIHLLSTYSRIILFADDTTIFSYHKSKQFLKYMIEHDMGILTDWFKANQLSLNMEKTIMIKFWPHNTPFEVHIEDIIVKNSKSTKFLGVTIDDNLNWSYHVNDLYSKLLANKRLLQNTKKLLSSTTLKLIYYVHIHNHLTYGLTVWGNMISKKMKKQIYQIQTACLKLLSSENQSKAIDIYLRHKILPFWLLIKQELIKLGYNLSANDVPTPIINIYKKEERKQHRYPTRRKNIPNIRKHQDSLFNKSFLCKSLVFYGELPDITRNLRNYNLFK